ncbi:MFS transporter [Candidatus Bathyarchaeota archaeon]|nr:MFS transporter [Candidatus Bathyarchaeota archaeon]
MLVKTRRRLGRNAKVLILTEPFWSIPVNWIFFYRPIFLSSAIKLSALEIGFLMTIFNSSLIIFPLLGGYMADRFGRKRVFMLFDSICWLSSLAIWVISRNVWHALLAYIIEGCASIVYSVWECLLVEDTEPKFRSFIYGSISAIFTTGSLTTPIAGYIIGTYGPDAGCRMLFTLAFCSLVIMYVVRQIYLREPEIGRKLMEDKTFSGFKGYLDSLLLAKRDRAILTMLLINIMIGFYNSSSAYVTLYLVNEKGLGLSEEAASIFPFSASIVSLMMALIVVPRLRSRSGCLKTLISGYSLGSLAMLLFITLPGRSLITALLSGLMLGVYLSVAFSVSRTFLANQIDVVDSRARAKILSIAVTLSSLINLPTPTVMGYLFSLNPKLPFFAILGIFIASIMLLTSLIILLKNGRRK